MKIGIVPRTWMRRLALIGGAAFLVLWSVSDVAIRVAA